MTDFDLEELGRLWRREPDPEAIRDLQRSAATVKRRAKAAMVFDYALAAAMVAAVLVIVAVNPRAEVLFVGGLAVLLLVLSQVRQRHFRRLELQGLTGDTEAMLDQTIARTQARLKRARSGLMLVGPAFLVGLLLGFVIDDTGTGALFTRKINEPMPPLLLFALEAAVVGALVIHLTMMLRRGSRELKRLVELRESYRREHESAASE